MIAEITFPDRSVSYHDFIRDLAAKINTFAKEDKDDPAYISQRKAEAPIFLHLNTLALP